MTDPIPVEARLSVAQIVAPAYVAFTKPAFDVGPVAPEKGPDPPVWRDRKNSAQSCCPGTSQQPVQDRFGLIGSRVTSSDHRQSEFLPNALEERQSCVAGRLLQIVGRGRQLRSSFELKWQFQPLGELGNESRISVRILTSKAVIQMQNREAKSELRGQFRHHVRKKNRVRATGNR